MLLLFCGTLDKLHKALVPFVAEPFRWNYNQELDITVWYAMEAAIKAELHDMYSVRRLTSPSEILIENPLTTTIAIQWQPETFTILSTEKLYNRDT